MGEERADNPLVLLRFQLVELGILRELKFEGAYNVREVKSQHSSQVPWTAK